MVVTSEALIAQVEVDFAQFVYFACYECVEHSSFRSYWLFIFRCI